jgi:carbonic anhydrase/acetyltransferase-like protein (isoleucine patch superfamily)
VSGPTILAYRGTLPTIAKDVYVAPTVSVIGDVEVGSEASLWFGAVLRGDVQPIRIGARTSIQDNSVVHATEGWAPTLVGADVTVGHMVVLHGCTIRDRVVVGMGSIVMDAAEIGEDTILGAGSLVLTEAKIPSGVLALGRPAKPVRDLTADELRSIRESAVHYVEKAREYLRS